MLRLSIELTDRCAKACAFCYARARPEGEAAANTAEGAGDVAFVFDPPPRAPPPKPARPTRKPWWKLW